MNESGSAIQAELDLRELMRPIIRNIWWIIGIAAVIAVLVYLGSRFMIEKKYVAQATVLLGAPRLNANLDNRVEIIQPAVDMKVIPGIAMSAQVLESVYAKAQPSDLTFGEFTSNLRATVTGNVVNFEATDSDPERSSQIANLWAETAAVEFDRLYGVSETVAAQLEEQVGTAEAEYNAAQQALLNYVPESLTESSRIRHDTTAAGYAELIAGRDRIDVLTSELQAFDNELAGHTSEETLSSSETLNLLGLQQRALAELLRPAAPAVVGTPAAELPATTTKSELIPELPTAAAEGPLSVKQGREEIEAYLTALQVQRQNLESQEPSLQDQLNSLRYDFMVAQTEEERLTAARDAAGEAYTALVNQLASLRIELASGMHPATIVHRAAPPTRPASPKVLLNTVGAGLLALALTIGVLLAIDWWRHTTREA